MGDVTKVMDGGLVATLHLPRVTGRRPGVIVIGGSDGGLASANLYGEPLAASGFVALCLAYFAMDGLPSHVVWQGMNSGSSMKTSSWSLAGVGLPFVPLATPRVGTLWRDWFEASLSQDSASAEAAIPVERINGSILFITGTEDGIWPCSAMVDLAMERLRRHRFGFYSEHARYEGGGHAILMPPYRVGPVENPWPSESYRQPQWMRSDLPGLAMGGTAGGNRLARMDAWPRMVAFLKQHLSVDGLATPNPAH